MLERTVMQCQDQSKLRMSNQCSLKHLLLRMYLLDMKWLLLTTVCFTYASGNFIKKIVTKIQLHSHADKIYMYITK